LPTDLPTVATTWRANCGLVTRILSEVKLSVFLISAQTAGVHAAGAQTGGTTATTGAQTSGALTSVQTPGVPAAATATHTIKSINNSRTPRIENLLSRLALRIPLLDTDIIPYTKGTQNSLRYLSHRFRPYWTALTASVLIYHAAL